MIETLKNKIKDFNLERKHTSHVKKLSLLRRITVGEIDFDGVPYTLLEETTIDGIKYAFFVSTKDPLSTMVLKSILDEDGDECWISLDSDQEFDRIFPYFYKKYYPTLADYLDEIIENNPSKEYVEEKIRNDYKQLTNILIKKELSISTMESATSGQIASLITDSEGASAIFPGSLVTYCNEMKIMYGVSKETIDAFSVYSNEVANEMALTCQKTFNTIIGIGVTGTMGNIDPVNPESSVPGQVYFSIAFYDKLYSYYVEIPKQPTRLQYKLAVAKEIYDELIKLILN